MWYKHFGPLEKTKLKASRGNERKQ